MTRINCIPVEELTDKHLLAEYRELPRVFKLAEAAYLRGDAGDCPQEYTLGKGHVKFFYTRLWWVQRRFDKLVLEMLNRGFSPRYHTTPAIARMPLSWWGDWEPTPQAMAINRERIAARLAGVKHA